MKEYETTTQYLFASDFHNDYKAIINLLNYAYGLQQSGKAEPEVVLLGDYLDGYSDNKDVIEMANLLSEVYNDIQLDKLPFKVNILRGNHDQFILDTINGDEHSLEQWTHNGGKDTLKELGYKGSVHSISGVSKFITSKYPGMVSFLKNTSIELETSAFYAVHGGINLSLKNPLDTPDEDKMWLRDNYYYDKEGCIKRNTLYKPIVSGHTISYKMNGTNEISILKRDINDIPRYVIDRSSNSGYIDGTVGYLILDSKGNFVKSGDAHELSEW